MRTLTGRLYTVQTLVPKGSRVADIGTDHGHLPISLIKEGISPFVLACDIREKPLASARKNIEKTATGNIETRLGDGLAAVNPCEVDCIVIAGMGGEVISGILERAPWVKNSKYTLVLQPMTSADYLRRYLYENGFSIETEKAVEDSAKLYSVLKVTYRGKTKALSEAFYRIGKLNPKNPTDLKYIKKQLDIATKCKLDLEKSGRDFTEYEALCREIKQILGEE